MTVYSFSLEYAFDEFVDAYMVSRGFRRKTITPWKVFLIFFLCATVFVFFISYRKGAFYPEDAIVPFALAAILGVIISWFPERFNRPSVERQLAVQWQQMGREGQRTNYVFDDKQLRIEDTIFGGYVGWSDLYGWSEDDEFVLIYRTELFYYYIPKAKVDTQTLAALKACLVASPARKL